MDILMYQEKHKKRTEWIEGVNQDIKVEFNKDIAWVKKTQIVIIAEMKNSLNLNLNLNGKHHQ